MIKTFAVILIIPTCFCIRVTAQRPDQLLEAWSAKAPIEKIYLHLDRENYIAGETAWFKAYLSSEYQPDTISTVIYVELANAAGVTISRAAVPIFLGVASGQVQLPDSLKSGTYQLRTYSPTMLNQETTYYGRSIFVYGRAEENARPLAKKTRIEFFPEGGSLLAGVNNVVAFKATNESGLPANIHGRIFNSKNATIITFNSYHDGMGMFDLTPDATEKYYAVVNEDPLAIKFFLPAATTKAIALTIVPHPQGHFFELNQKGTHPDFRASYMIGQMQHHIVFRQEFKGANEEFRGVINTGNLQSGILQVSFFNSDNQPVAERLCFVDNKEYKITGKLTADTINFLAKGKNRFSVHLNDTIRGSFSIAVTDAEYQPGSQRDENILSSFLISSDLRGYVHCPSYYFSSDNDSVKTALDLLMMTNGWRRFRWDELAQKLNKPLLYKDPSYITLAGKLSLRDSKKPFDDKPALMMLLTADSTRRIEMLHTDRLGNFKIDSLLFFGKSQIMFADIRGRKSQFIDAHLAGDTLFRVYPLANQPVPQREDLLLLASRSKYDVDFQNIFREKGVLLQGVTVTSRKRKTPLEELDDKYTSGAFSSDARKVFDLVNTDDAKFYSSIMELLRAKGYSPDDRTRQSISSLGPYVPEIYLDEYLADVDILETMPLSRIAMIKIYSTFSGGWGNGAGGAIALYTKKGEDLWSSAESSTAIVRYNGYTISKEFYAPDYAVLPEKNETDTRITLDWRPDIFVNNISPRIPFSFYNNDRTKRFRIVVEGMTFDGKMLLIEQTF